MSLSPPAGDELLASQSMGCQILVQIRHKHTGPWRGGGQARIFCIIPVAHLRRANFLDILCFYLGVPLAHQGARLRRVHFLLGSRACGPQGGRVLTIPACAGAKSVKTVVRTSLKHSCWMMVQRLHHFLLNAMNTCAWMFCECWKDDLRFYDDPSLFTL